VRAGRARSLKLENHFEKMGVAELLREPYSGEQFPGYENINHDFTLLETGFRTHRPDWKAALANIRALPDIGQEQWQEICWLRLWRDRYLVPLEQLSRQRPWWQQGLGETDRSRRLLLRPRKFPPYRDRISACQDR
jgi:hypothetical protein